MRKSLPLVAVFLLAVLLMVEASRVSGSGVWALATVTGVAAVIAYHKTRHTIRRLTRLRREVEDLYHHAPCGYHSLNRDGVIIKINDTELSWLGYTRSEVIGKLAYEEVVIPEDRARFRQAFARVGEASSPVEIECTIEGQEGRRRTVLIRATAKRDDDGFIHSRGAAYDITERKQMEDELRKLVRTDVLTGLGNRRMLDDMGQHEVNRHARTGSSLALAVIDIDRFKRINDRYGHHAGDQVLKHLADESVNASRQSDVICRLGGEEFVFLLPDADVDGARVLMERLRQRIEAASVEILTAEDQPSSIRYTFSCGVCAVDTSLEGDKAIRKAIHQADHALYVGKEEGRNRVVLA